MGQAVVAVVDRQHLVALQDPDSDGRTDDGVHSRARGPNVQEGDVDVALWVFVEVAVRRNVDPPPLGLDPAPPFTFESGRCT